MLTKDNFQKLSILSFLLLGGVIGAVLVDLTRSESIIIQISAQILFSIGAFFIPLQFYARRIMRRLNWPITLQTRLISIFIAYLIWLPAIFLCMGSPFLGELFPRGNVLLFQILVIDKTTFGWLFLAVLWLGIGFLFVEFKKVTFITKIGITVGVLVMITSGIFLITKRQPVTCAQIEERELYDFIHNTTPPLTSDKTEAWFRQSSFHDLSPDFTYWQRDNIEYFINFRDEAVVDAQVFWHFGKTIGLQPTLGEIVNCFGEPEFYRAWYSPEPELKLGFELWYVEDGIVIGTVKNYLFRIKPPVIDEKLIMETLIFIPPIDNREVMIRNIYDNVLPKRTETTTNPLKEWPDSNEEFEVSVIPTDK